MHWEYYGLLSIFWIINSEKAMNELWLLKKKIELK
jgi:hypothetical protein